MSSVKLHPKYGNTIAGLIVFSDLATMDWSVDPYARLQFHQSNALTGEYVYYDAVYCTELYADNIAKEKENDNYGNDFTEAFADYQGTHKWICPNITDEIEISKDFTLVLNYLPCDAAYGAVYAEGVACKTFEVDESK